MRTKSKCYKIVTNCVALLFCCETKQQNAPLGGAFFNSHENNLACGNSTLLHIHPSNHSQSFLFWKEPHFFNSWIPTSHNIKLLPCNGMENLLQGPYIKIFELSCFFSTGLEPTYIIFYAQNDEGHINV